MALNYLHRQIAEHVSRHTVQRLPDPSRADFEAQVFDVEWRSANTRLIFPVLALDGKHAMELAKIRLTQWVESTDNVRLTYCQPRTTFSVDALHALLTSETATEWAHRQDEWQQREVGR